jgi:membrane fusion protein (multidrug efflux system)
MRYPHVVEPVRAQSFQCVKMDLWMTTAAEKWPIRVRARWAPVLLLLAWGCAEKPERETPIPEGGYVAVKATNVPLWTELPGRTTALETSEVRPQVSGLILRQLFVEGGQVRMGQPLYQIDPDIYQAAVKQAQANLQFAIASQKNASAKAARYGKLVGLQAVSQQEYSDADAAAEQAAASVSQARAALETARLNLRFTTVPAPISGRIGRSLVTTGALVTNGQSAPLAQIQRLDPIYVDVQQSSAELLALRQELAKGRVAPSTAAVKLKLENGADYPYPGQLQFSEAVVDPATGAVTLRARFPNPQALLLPGLFVRAVLSQATTNNGILVPQAAVTRDPRGRATVMLVGPDDTAVRRRIVVTRTSGPFWIATSGLSTGDKVIVEGLAKIKAGQKFVPVPAGAGSKSNDGAAHKARKVAVVRLRIGPILT